MIFDPEEHEKAKALYLQAILGAVDEAEKAGDASPHDAALSELEITERSGLSRHLVERLSDELDQTGLIQCLGGVGPPRGRSYCLRACVKSND